jgi:hypothetical protein
VKIPSEISDHDPNVAFYNVQRVLLVHSNGKSGYMIKLTKKKVIEKLKIVYWMKLLCQFDDVDDMCNQFTKTFLELAMECIPTKTITVRYNDKPWFQ